MSLKQLISLSLSGDKEAFDTIIKRYDSSVRGYVVSLCHSEFDCNDILQETYIKAFLNLNKYNASYPMDIWLKTIAHNLFIDLKRKELREAGTIISSEDTATISVEESGSPEELIITYQRVKAAEQEISMLPSHYRKIIELRYFEQMSYNEIAEALSQPIGTVKTQLFRAKKLLSSIIKELSKSGF
ncbi:MAG: RNA polymerase sigma factor [Rikenellaceae bacterium]